VHEAGEANDRRPRHHPAPVVSEKSYGLIDHDTYTFIVPREATKIDVRHAVEEIWGVKVVGVNTSNRKGKTKRTRNMTARGQARSGPSSSSPKATRSNSSRHGRIRP